MIIEVPVTVLCEGCAQCPRLKIGSEKEYDRAGRVISQEYECLNMNECIDVKEAMDRARDARKETEGEG